MAKAKLSPVFDEVRGAYGDLVFKEVNGITVWAHKPVQKDGPNTAQTAFRTRCLRANEYAKLVSKDPGMLALYEEAAERTGKSVRRLCTSDFHHQPEISEFHLDAYNGRIGDLIQFVAMDDFGVVRATVTLSDEEEGTLIEQGEAVPQVDGTAYWQYAATKAVPAGISVIVRIEAYDRPYGRGTISGTKPIVQLD